MINFLKSKTAKAAVGLIAIAMVFATAVQTASAEITSTLRKGSSGSQVVELQNGLNTMGYANPALVADGKFGAKTDVAVKAFQAAKGLVADGIFGAKSRAAWTGTGPVTPNATLCPNGMTLASNCTMPPSGGTQTGPVMAMLSTDNPAAGYYAATQAGASLLKVNFTGNGTVTNVKLQKIGVAADSSYSNVYLFDGNTRLTDGASISNNGVITFSNPSGLFTVSGSRVITVKADLASSGSEVIGVSLSSFTTLGSTTPVMVSGVTGNQFSLVSASGLATAALVSATATPSASSIDPQNDYVVWQNNVNVSSREAKLVSMALKEVGSINYGDVNNFRLLVDGATVATTQSIDSNGYVTFVPTTPVVLSTNTHVFKVMADVVGGAYRNFKFEVRNKVDMNIVDSQSGYGISVTGTVPNPAGVQTINNGNITVQKASNSPSGDVIYNGSDVVLARYTLRTFGEAVKIDTIKASVTLSSGTGGLRSGRILIDGQQVGSTTTLAEDSASTPYTSYNANYTLQAGTTATLEIRADLYETGAGAAVAAAVTAVANLEDVSSMLNAQGVTSGQTFDFPTSDIAGNTLTVRAGTATVAKYTSYANQTTVAPKTAYLLGKWAITAGTVEDVNMDTFSFATTYADAFADADLNNVMMKVDGVQVSTTKSTVTSPFSFSANVLIPKGTTKYVELYADILSSATDGDGSADTVYATLTASGTTTPSGASVAPSGVDGQTITASTGSFTTSLDGSSPFARTVAGNQEVVGASYKFQAVNETYTVKEIQVKVASAGAASTISTVQLYDGATAIGAATPFSGTTALVTGLNLVVNANTSKVVTAKLMLNTIGTGAGTSQSDAALTLDSAKYADSQGVETTDATDRAGNAMYVFKSVPTVAKLSANLTNAVNNSASDLYKFSVTASSKGDVAVKQFKLATTWSDPGTDSTLALTNIKLIEDGSDVTASTVSIVDEDGNNVESTGFAEADDTLIVSWDAGYESVVPAGTTKTYTVRGTLSGFVAQPGVESNSVTFAFNGDTSANGTSVYLNDETDIGAGQSEIWELFTSAAANSSDGTAMKFIWSDMSSSAHTSAGNASSTGDWANGFKVLNFDLDTETFSTAL